jgi:GNAT superfamily N-acetyltransferase
MSEIMTADEVSTDELDAFLHKVYTPKKADFLAEHGKWWHKGNHNRWVISQDEQIAAYCAIIPTAVNVLGDPHETFWWVDLIVDKPYRGRGLQTLFDEKIRNTADLKLGFPNELAAKIHLKHGWGVRGDLRYMVAPLVPRQLKRVQVSTGAKGLLYKGGALALTPVSSLYKALLRRTSLMGVTEMHQPQAGELADIYHRHTPHETLITTYRDEAFIQWRYLDAPYRDQLRFFTAGEKVTIVTRTLDWQYGRITRILDVFGALDDEQTVRLALRAALTAAIEQGATEVNGIFAHPGLISVCKAMGFILSVGTLFCWHSDNQTMMNTLSDGSFHWLLHDSDNDEPPLE